MRVGRHAVDFHTQFLEIGIIVGQVFQLGRADEGEIGRIEEEDGPLAFNFGIRYSDELAILERFGLERLDFASYQRHSIFSLVQGQID
jgi:hypothetical protein